MNESAAARTPAGPRTRRRVILCAGIAVVDFIFRVERFPTPSTKAPTLLWQAASQGSPYGFFFANLHQNALIPSGQDATSTGNWEHFSDPSATGLLNQWKRSLKPEVQHALATKVQAVWLKTLPVIPLFIGPRWSTYSTKYFHCFASPKNYYGDPIFTTFPDNVLSFTKICPGAQTGP